MTHLNTNRTLRWQGTEQCSVFFCAYSQGQNFPHLGHPILLICSSSQVFSGQGERLLWELLWEMTLKAGFFFPRLVIPTHLGVTRMTPSPFQVH